MLDALFDNESCPFGLISLPLFVILSRYTFQLGVLSNMYTYWEASTALGFHTSPQMALSFTWVTSSLVVGQRGSTVIQYRQQSRLSVALHKLTVSVVLPCVSSFVLPSPFLSPSLPMEIISLPCSFTLYLTSMVTSVVDGLSKT